LRKTVKEFLNIFLGDFQFYYRKAKV